jgi:hypothetical protein
MTDLRAAKGSVRRSMTAQQDLHRLPAGTSPPRRAVTPPVPAARWVTRNEGPTRSRPLAVGFLTSIWSGTQDPPLLGYTRSAPRERGKCWLIAHQATRRSDGSRRAQRRIWPGRLRVVVRDRRTRIRLRSRCSLRRSHRDEGPGSRDRNHAVVATGIRHTIAHGCDTHDELVKSNFDRAQDEAGPPEENLSPPRREASPASSARR